MIYIQFLDQNSYKCLKELKVYDFCNIPQVGDYWTYNRDLYTVKDRMFKQDLDEILIIVKLTREDTVKYHE